MTRSDELVDNSKINPPSTPARYRLFIPIIVSVSTLVFLLSIAVVLPVHWLSPSQNFVFNNSLIEIALLVIFAALSIAAVLTVVAVALLSRLKTVPPDKQADSDSRVSPGAATPNTNIREAKRILRLNRSAERLVTVEQDLVRKISESYNIDRRTYRLLTEVQICTNRLRYQLQDLQRAPETYTDELSDMKLDDITVG